MRGLGETVQLVTVPALGRCGETRVQRRYSAIHTQLPVRQGLKLITRFSKFTCTSGQGLACAGIEQGPGIVVFL